MNGTIADRPLWIHRRVISRQAIREWCMEAGIRKVIPFDQQHFTQATVRTPVEWGDLMLDPNELVIPAGPKPTRIFAYTIKALTFDHPLIQARHAWLRERFPAMDHAKIMRPHVSLYKGGRMPRTEFEGEIVLGPEIAEEFVAGNALGIKHVRTDDALPA